MNLQTRSAPVLKFPTSCRTPVQAVSGWKWPTGPALQYRRSLLNVLKNAGLMQLFGQKSSLTIKAVQKQQSITEMSNYAIQAICCKAIKEYAGNLGNKSDAAVIDRMLNWLTQQCSTSGSELPEAIRQAPEQTILGLGNESTAKSLQQMGAMCREPWHYGCMMEVCYDHGLLSDRTQATAFARTLVALGIVRYQGPDALHKLAGKIASTVKKMPVSYRNLGNELREYRDKCENLAACLSEVRDKTNYL